MDIRTLTSGDEELLISGVAMIEEASLTLEQARKHLADPFLVAIAAIADGQVVGFLYGYELRRFEAVTFFVYAVDVHEDWRRQGIARGMFDQVRHVAFQRGWNEGFVLTNRSNAPAMALYDLMGGTSPPPDDVVMFDFRYN